MPRASPVTLATPSPLLAAYAAVLGHLGQAASGAALVGDGLSDELAGVRRAGFVRVI